MKTDVGKALLLSTVVIAVVLRKTIQLSCHACGVRGRDAPVLPPCTEDSPGSATEICPGKCYVMYNAKNKMTFGDRVIAKGCTDLSFIRLDDGSDGPCGTMFGDRINQEQGYNVTYFVPLCLCDTDGCNFNNSACHYAAESCIDPIPWADEPCRRRRGLPNDWCLRGPSLGSLHSPHLVFTTALASLAGLPVLLLAVLRSQPD